jgi:hypothetical protein
MSEKLYLKSVEKEDLTEAAHLDHPKHKDSTEQPPTDLDPIEIIGKIYDDYINYQKKK